MVVINVAGMLRNHRLAGAVADTGFGEFRRQMEYKAAWYGVGLLIAGRFYPSSKRCSACGSVKPERPSGRSCARSVERSWTAT